MPLHAQNFAQVFKDRLLMSNVFVRKRIATKSDPILIFTLYSKKEKNYLA